MLTLFHGRWTFGGTCTITCVKCHALGSFELCRGTHWSIGMSLASQVKVRRFESRRNPARSEDSLHQASVADVIRALFTQSHASHPYICIWGNSLVTYQMTAVSPRVLWFPLPEKPDHHDMLI